MIRKSLKIIMGAALLAALTQGCEASKHEDPADAVGADATGADAIDASGTDSGSGDAIATTDTGNNMSGMDM